MWHRKTYWRPLFTGLLLGFAASLAQANAPVPQPGNAGTSLSGSTAAAGGESLDSLDQRILELQNQMARVEEEVARVNRERTELLARLDDLDAQIILARQLVSSRSQQLALLQANLAAEARRQAQLEAGQEAVAAAAAEAEAEAAARAEREAAADDPLLNPVIIVIGAVLLLLTLAVVRMLRASRQQASAEKAITGTPAYTETKTAENTEKDTAFEAETETTEAPVHGKVEDDSEDFDGEIFRIEPDGGTGEAAENPVPEAGYLDDPGEIPDGGDDSGADDDYVIELDNGDEEEIAERLNLAYSFHRMGDSEQARRILEQVIRVGNEAQVSEARQLLAIIHDLN